LWWGVCGPIALAADSADELLRRGRVADALALAAKDAVERPGDLAAQELLIDIRMTMGAQPTAEREARDRVAAHPTDADAHYLLGRARADPKSSRAAYEAALSLAPGHARAQMGMGSLHAAAGRHAEASAAFAAATAADRSLVEAWLGRVRAALAADDLATARTIAAEAHAAVPDAPPLALAAAQLNPERAEATLSETLKRVGADPEVSGALAAHKLANGHPAEAAQLASDALLDDPTIGDARRTLLFARELASGRLVSMEALEAARRLEVTDPAAALAAYVALVADNPKSSLVLLGRASARRITGDKSGALQDVIAAALADPTNDEAAAVAGLALREAGRPAEAVLHLRLAFEARPWDPSLGLALVAALREDGNSEAARATIASLAAAMPLDVDVQLHYAQSLLDQRNYNRAYGVLKLAMLIRPDPRLLAAFIRVAPLAGHPGEAADVLEPVAQQTNNPSLMQAVLRLRKMAETTR